MSTKDTVTSGQFDRRITIQAPPTGWVDDGQGANTAAWADLYTCWADKQDFPHGRFLYRKFLFQQLFPQATTTFCIRYQAEVPVDASMRVKYVKAGITHYYKILGVENLYDANTSVYLMCQEDQAQAPN